MDFFVHVREAFRNLLSSKLRSFLAILGVLVGTGSVVALISSSQLATAHALAQFKELGTNLLAMSIESSQAAATSGKQQSQFRLEDESKLSNASNKIQLIAPYTTIFGNIIFKNLNTSGEMLGVTSALSQIVKIKIAEGRSISYLDGHEFYCVIGSKLAEKIKKQGINPIGQQVMINSRYFTVVGIAKPWQPNLFLFADINNGALIPLETSYLLSKDTVINNVLFRLTPNPNLKAVQEQLEGVMKTYFPEKRVQFRNPEQIIQVVAKQRETFTWLLSAIGGISLLVGGIGVMNIMLVSVVERRREIGIRMAIGARRSDISRMFLIESVILTVFGGIIGILIGIGVSFTIAEITQWQFTFYVLPPLLGFVVSVLVGILSGIYPARRAARLDPIQTLQSD